MSVEDERGHRARATHINTTLSATEYEAKPKTLINYIDDLEKCNELLINIIGDLQNAIEPIAYCKPKCNPENVAEVTENDPNWIFFEKDPNCFGGEFPLESRLTKLTYSYNKSIDTIRTIIQDLRI